MLIFGVHSADYERANKWDELAAFCDKFRDKPQEFWSATNREIFEYEDALKDLCIKDGKIKNTSEKTLYVKIDGEKIVLAPKSEITV